MPFRYGRENNFSVRLNGTEAEQQKVLKVLDNLSEYAGYSPEEKLSNAVDTIAKRIVWEGRAQFELIPLDDGATFFHKVPTKRLFRLMGFAVQYLSREDRQFWKSAALRWAPRSTLWHIDVPHELGGRRGYLRLLSSLQKFGDLGPAFMSTDGWFEKRPRNFDIKEYVRLNSIFLYKVAHAWGWNRRDFSTEQTTEFYSLYRSATAEKAKRIFRTHIISQINILLVRLEINCTISVEGLPSVEGAQQMKDKLVTSELSFRDFLDARYDS
ncbi:hypothetical protein EGI20_13120 [Aquitalea sp. S1-19]|nr:hypothetical protein [Aquitalea sp. S1-19]